MEGNKYNSSEENKDNSSRNKNMNNIYPVFKKSESLKIYYFVGRLNPPNPAHIELLKKLILEASKNSSVAYILLENGPNKKLTIKDPLPFKTKLDFLNYVLPKNAPYIIDEVSNEPSDQAYKIKLWYDKILKSYTLHDISPEYRPQVLKPYKYILNGPKESHEPHSPLGVYKPITPPKVEPVFAEYNPQTSVKIYDPVQRFNDSQFNTVLTPPPTDITFIKYTSKKDIKLNEINNELQKIITNAPCPVSYKVETNNYIKIGKSRVWYSSKSILDGIYNSYLNGDNTYELFEKEYRTFYDSFYKKILDEILKQILKKTEFGYLSEYAIRNFIKNGIVPTPENKKNFIDTVTNYTKKTTNKKIDTPKVKVVKQSKIKKANVVAAVTNKVKMNKISSNAINNFKGKSISPNATNKFKGKLSLNAKHNTLKHNKPYKFFWQQNYPDLTNNVKVDKPFKGKIGRIIID